MSDPKVSLQSAISHLASNNPAIAFIHHAIDGIKEQEAWEERAVASMDAASLAAGVMCCDLIPSAIKKLKLNGLHITEEDAKLLWIAILYGGTLGERLGIAMRVLGPIPDDVVEMDDEECPWCKRDMGSDDD